MFHVYVVLNVIEVAVYITPCWDVPSVWDWQRKWNLLLVMMLKTISDIHVDSGLSNLQNGMHAKIVMKYIQCISPFKLNYNDLYKNSFGGIQLRCLKDVLYFG